MRDLFSGDVNNTVNTRSVYGAAPGGSTAQRAGASTPYTAGRNAGPDTADAQTGPAAPAPAGLLGQPFSWWAVLIALLVGLMWTAQRYGSEGQSFSTVKLSVYNIVVITLASIIGIGFFKLAFGRYNVPGLSTFIAAI